MKKIVTILQPFDLKQTIYVYEDGNKIQVAEIETAEVADGICKLAQSLEIKEINLGGAKQYAKGLGKKIQEAATIQYSITDLEIKYL